MRGHKVLYCEIDFIKALFERLNKTYSPLDDASESVECARKILKDVFAQQYVSVQFDDKQKFHQLMEENEYFRKMVNRGLYTEGYPELNCDAYFSLDEVSDNGLNALYFVISGEEKAKQKGIMALTPSSINNLSLFRDFGLAVQKNTPLSWEDILMRAKHNCNALIVFDNFLYKDKECNLYEILDSLLPEQLDDQMDFHISIFMQLRLGVSKENEYDSINEKIKQIRPKLAVNLTLYQCITSDFHDRAIITNNLLIGSEGGFDLLRKDRRGFRTESSKSTTIHMKYPFLQNNADSSYGTYSNFIQDAKRIIRSNNQHVGTGMNRLI